MKIILASVGSRGDMEPFLAIAEILQQKGHDVICLFPEQFRSLAEDSGFKFASLGTKFIELLDSPAGRIAMGGGSFGWKKMKAYKTLISKQTDINREMMHKQYEAIKKENPDRVVHHTKAIYPVIWGIENKDKTILVSPVPYLHYVKDHAHIAFNRDFGAFFNKLSYKLANFGLLKSIMASLKFLDETKNYKQKQIQSALLLTKTIYTVSPTLFKRPDYWDNRLKVLGYYERSKTTNWKPDQTLESFLQRHSKVILVTFGSMINMDPPAKTKIMLDVLERNNIPAIINTASGGLVKPSSYNKDLFYFVDRIPYDWAFPQLYAIIHHGGSGTTHTAIKYGCPSLIIPHIIDQYVWNKLVHKKGLGPLGMDVSKISVKKLEPKILDLLGNQSYKEKAMQLSEKMQLEDYKDQVEQAIVAEG